MFGRKHRYRKKKINATYKASNDNTPYEAMKVAA